jgi:hypothetical protein
MNNLVIKNGIVFVPGFNSTRLQHQKYNKAARDVFRKDVKYNMSVYTGLLTNISMKEWMDDFKVVYNPVSNNYESCEHVFIGESSGYDLDSVRNLSFELETMDRILKHISFIPNSVSDFAHNKYAYRYFDSMIEIVKKNKYYEGRTIMAMPYDFRLILQDGMLDEYMESIRTGCEEMLLENSEKHTVVCHSMGGLLMYYFLVCHVNNEWVEQHISNVVFVNVPWGGVSILYKYILHGYHYLPQYRLQYRELITKFDGFHLCLPNRYGFNENEVLMTTKSEKYTSSDVDKLYEDIDDIVSLHALLHSKENTDKVINSLTRRIPKETNVHIVYNTSVRTPNTFVSNSPIEQLSNSNTSKTKINYESDTSCTYCPGDGLVTKSSLDALRRLHRFAPNYHFYEFSNIPKNLNITHTNILDYPPVLNLLQNVSSQRIQYEPSKKLKSKSKLKPKNNTKTI